MDHKAEFKLLVLERFGKNDDLLDVSHAERLYEWAQEPKQILVFDRGDHNTILVANEEAYFTAVERFIASCCFP